MNICGKAKIVDWEVRTRLNNAITLSTLLYGAEVWALTYCDVLERRNILFFICLLSLSRSTPNAIVRLECGLTHISQKILERSLKLFFKISRMPENRYPKICLNKLVKLHLLNPRNIKYNWFTQLYKLLEQIGQSHLLETQNLQFLLQLIPSVLNQ